MQRRQLHAKSAHRAGILLSQLLSDGAHILLSFREYDPGFKACNHAEILIAAVATIALGIAARQNVWDPQVGRWKVIGNREVKTSRQNTDDRIGDGIHLDC